MGSDDESASTAVEVLRVTEAARTAILVARADEPNSTELGLFIEVSGAENGSYIYDMWFEAPQDAGVSDVTEVLDDLTVVVVASSVDKISGATLDVGTDGLVIVNPNTPPAPPLSTRPFVPESDLTDPLELAILALLEEEINPQIATHGGRADLVAVANATAYLRLSGGCQGCGMAAVTLSQGITVAIKEAVPAIVDVVDVTDHEHGENPYFAGAKK